MQRQERGAGQRPHQVDTGAAHAVRYLGGTAGGQLAGGSQFGVIGDIRWRQQVKVGGEERFAFGLINSKPFFALHSHLWPPSQNNQN